MVDLSVAVKDSLLVALLVFYSAAEWVVLMEKMRVGAWVANLAEWD